MTDPSIPPPLKKKQKAESEKRVNNMELVFIFKYALLFIVDL